MQNNPEPADVKKIWQNQSLEGATMSLEAVRAKIGELEKEVRKRSLMGGLVVLVAFALMARQLYRDHNLVEYIGTVLSIIAVGYIAYQLILVGKKPSESMSRETNPPTSAAFYRNELGRQRDFHRGLWFWSRVVVFAPGPLIFMIGEIMEHPQAARRFQFIAAVFVALLILAVPMNLRRARKYQREIDALDTATH
jgi:hypothetical protein